MLIATYIKDDLAARLKSGGVLPAPLTLDALAEHYHVSFTPVRMAIAELIDEGLLKKGANRRLTASVQSKQSPKGLSEPHLPDPPRDLSHDISGDLVQLSLRGEAVYLREEASAEKYKISRSAVRNVFHRLAGEGILDHIPRRGWKLRPFRQKDLQAFIEIREVLELKALDLARPHLASENLIRMLAANLPPETETECPRIDESLHEYLIEAAANPYIKDFFERQGRYYRLLFSWEDHDRDTAVETVRQHREILTALLSKNWTAARKALSHHILNNHPILSRFQ